MYLILKATQEKIKVTVKLLEAEDLKYLEKDWLFDWKKEYLKLENRVYKLVTINDNFIHGLISFKPFNSEYLFLDLLEVATINKGKNKVYENTVGILFAHACKIAFELGFDGYCVFDSKTVLRQYYNTAYGAIPLNAQRMYFDTKQAIILINKYLEQ